MTFPIHGEDPRITLRHAQLAIAFQKASQSLHDNPTWRQLCEDLRALRLSHLEALTRAECNLDYERGFIHAVDWLLGYRKPDARQTAKLESAVGRLQEEIASLHDAGLLPPMAGGDERNPR